MSFHFLLFFLFMCNHAVHAVHGFLYNYSYKYIHCNLLVHSWLANNVNNYSESKLKQDLHESPPLHAVPTILHHIYT